jgi:hypothetical protein
MWCAKGQSAVGWGGQARVSRFFGFSVWRVFFFYVCVVFEKTEAQKSRRRRCGHGTNSVHVQRLPWTSKAHRLCSKT